MGHSDTARAMHFTLCSGRVKISGRYTVTTETCGGPRLVRSGYIYISCSIYKAETFGLFQGGRNEVGTISGLSFRSIK